MLVNETHPLNAYEPISVAFEIDTYDKALQYPNVYPGTSNIGKLTIEIE